jgi:hypothetical protein
MNTLAVVALAVWVAVTAVGCWLWAPRRRVPRSAKAARTAGIISVATLAAGTALVAVLAGLGRPLTGPWAWLAVAVALASALLTGGAATRLLLDLADGSTRAPRVQKSVLRGGAWIGALERVGLVAAILAHWPEGIAVIIAIKGLARYPELKTSQGTGAAERFIIGTFASLGWAAACAGIAVVLT